MTASPKSKIRVLPAELASQIAAGEVVERPASVVKELIENSLDAGARRIEVVIAAGGLERIEIRDDGQGMSPSDARLALERHATSKLSALTDLDSLTSYGFRGEALPSIASVSRFRLTTRTRDFEGASELRLDGVAVEKAKPAATVVGAPVGTSIVVAELFHNVPARRKFLRSTATESGHVGDVVDAAALCRPDVAFSLERDGRVVKNYPRASSREERVGQVLGADGLALARGERGPLSLEAHLASPERSRQGTSGLTLILNRRHIKDRALAATLAHAYGAGLERGRYPRGVVYLELDPALVDVNVHPQKTEVRFADSRAVSDAVHGIVRDSLPRAWSSGVTSSDEKSGAAGKNGAAGKENLARSKTPSTAGAATSSLVHHKAWPVREPIRAAAAPLSDRAPPAAEPSSARGPGTAGWKRLRFVARARARYLWCEGEDGFYLLDALRLHRHVLGSELERDYESGRAKNQSLLFPLTLPATPEQLAGLAAHAESAAKLGFDLRARGEHAVSVHAVPLRLERLQAETLAALLLSRLSTKASPAELRRSSFQAFVDADVARVREQPNELEPAPLVKAFADLDLDPATRESCVLGFDSFVSLNGRADRP